MFREITRFKQKLPEEECREILKTQLRGVLSLVGDEGYPYGVPLNHYYCPEENRLYFHSGKIGHKIDAMRQNPKASFTVLDEGEKEAGGWALNFRSVIVFGRLEEVQEWDKMLDITRRLSHKFTDDEAYIEDEIARSAKGTLLFALNIEHISGKKVNEK